MMLVGDEKHEALVLLRQARNRCAQAAKVTEPGDASLAASCRAVERQIADILTYIEVGAFPLTVGGPR